METRFFRLVLTTAIASLLAPAALAADALFEPELERREVSKPQIDGRDIQVGLFAGVLSIEDFGSSAIYGAQLLFHVTEDFFLEGQFALAQAGNTSYENLSGSAPLLTDDERDWQTYTAAVGYNLLPGEGFFWGNAFTSSFYLVAGAGGTSFAGEDNMAIVAGGGYRLLISDSWTFDLSARDYMVSLDVTGEDKLTHNLALLGGVAYTF